MVLGTPLGRALFPRRGEINVGTTMKTETALRIGADGTVERVALHVDAHGSCGGSLRELIGCRLFEVISLDEGVDAWVDEEALVTLDLDDPAAVAAAVNVVGSLVVGRRVGVPLGSSLLGSVVLTGRRGERTVGLDRVELERLECLAVAASLVVGAAAGDRG